MKLNTIYCGDALETLKTFPDECVQCVVTSPPYWGLRDYGVVGQLGLEKTPEEYVAKMIEVFREVQRVLRKDGTLWLNLGDSYAAGGNGGQGEKQQSNRGTRAIAGKAKKAPQGLKPKDLVGIPWRVAFALQSDGWYLRQDIIWAKPNPMPESVTDRCTKSHEYIFLLAKSQKYYFDNEAIKEPMTVPERYNTRLRDPNHEQKRSNQGGRAGIINMKTLEKHREKYLEHPFRNKRSVWIITTKSYPNAHFATFPPELPELCIKAGTKEGDVVLDPFMGSGTTALVAKKHSRQFVGIELNPEYVKLCEKRLQQQFLF